MDHLQNNARCKKKSTVALDNRCFRQGVLDYTRWKIIRHKWANNPKAEIFKYTRINVCGYSLNRRISYPNTV